MCRAKTIAIAIRQYSSTISRKADQGTLQGNLLNCRGLILLLSNSQVFSFSNEPASLRVEFRRCLLCLFHKLAITVAAPEKVKQIRR
ncbi:hypothetical protein RRF57_004292 [Xylaria bambusicola]|uniref:Uncharacterized protein n=1 Tax=Xylaria bambusicola TaxID=326684 RepID=A0AAN7Z3P7_9PEZI